MKKVFTLAALSLTLTLSACFGGPCTPSFWESSGNFGQLPYFWEKDYTVLVQEEVGNYTGETDIRAGHYQEPFGEPILGYKVCVYDEEGQRHFIIMRNGQVVFHMDDEPDHIIDGWCGI